MINLFSDFVESMENIGAWTPLDDEKSCQLLAWLLQYGGGCEATTQNPIMFAHIKSSQRKLNIEGGQVPNKHLAKKMQAYYREILQFEADKYAKMPDWLKDIFVRYRVGHVRLKK